MSRNKDLMLELSKGDSDAAWEADVAWETMIKEVCDNCPLNAL